MTILALDLGTHTGFAIRLRDGTIQHGTKDLTTKNKQSGGRIFLRFRVWLNEMRPLGDAQHVIYFEEVKSHPGGGVEAAHMYGGFQAELMAWCELNKVPYEGVGVGTIKKHATTVGNASKERVMEAMVKKGFKPIDDNAADALALLHLAMEKEDAK